MMPDSDQPTVDALARVIAERDAEIVELKGQIRWLRGLLVPVRDKIPALRAALYTLEEDLEHVDDGL